MIFDDIIHSIEEGESEETLELTKQALAQGYSASSILEKGLITGINIIAEKYRTEKVNVPEVLMATHSMHAGLSVIEPILTAPTKKGLGKIIVGTVAGDLHDIGKNLVIMMIESAGFEVVDLGVDVPIEKFIEAAKDPEVNIVGASALLTTTMPALRATVEALNKCEYRDRIKVMVGGAPVTQEFADEIGADGYTADAASAAEMAKTFVA